MDNATEPTLELLLTEVQRLRSEVDDLRAERHPQSEAATHTSPSETPDPTPALELVTDRRSALKRAAAAAAGIAAGGTALALAQAQPAAATDNNAILAGVTNTSTAVTRLNNTGGLPAGQNIFTVQDGTFTGSAFPAALAGFAIGTPVDHGVYGYSEAVGGYAVVASPNDDGAAALLLRGDGPPPPTRATSFIRGAMTTDSNSDIWACVVSGSPGTWRKVAGPGTAGQLHVLPTPVRCYESRAILPNGGGPKGVLLGGTQRTVDTKNNSTGVPNGATAVLVNLTVTSASGAGFLALYSNALGAWPGTSNINWSFNGQAIANMAVVAVDSAAMLKAFANADTHFLIDVIGFFR